MEEKTYFDTLYDATDGDKKEQQKPFVHNRVNRALAGATDSYASRKIDAEEKIAALYSKLALGNTDAIAEIVSLELDIDEINAQANKVAQIVTKLARKQEV